MTWHSFKDRASWTAFNGITALAAMAIIAGPLSAFRAWYERRKEAGRPIYVDELPGARARA
jgi:hypothetical protein